MCRIQNSTLGHFANLCRLSHLSCPKSEKPSSRSRGPDSLKHNTITQVKCDETPDECGNCARLRLVCSGYTTPVRSQTTGGEIDLRHSTRVKRTYRSCTACRASKTKCSGERPCQRCRWKCSTECVYAESTQPAWVRRVNMTQTGSPDFSLSRPSMSEQSFEETPPRQANPPSLMDTPSTPQAFPGSSSSPLDW
jgi:hypothetical protein